MLRGAGRPRACRLPSASKRPTAELVTSKLDQASRHNGGQEQGRRRRDPTPVTKRDPSKGLRKFWLGDQRSTQRAQEPERFC
jgi:hypothetical protein